MSVMQKEMPDNDNLSMEWDPFSDEQIEGLFFSGGGRAEMLDQLQHLLRYGSSLTILAGEPGVGKGFLVDKLLPQLDPDLFDIADIQADVMMSFEQILHLLDEPWRSLRPFTLENFQEMVPAVATAADDESKTLLCILRDAEQLDAEVLDQLQILLSVSAGLPVKCLLVAAVAEVENAAALHGLIGAMPDSHVLYLDPLSREQVEAYLQYRMHTAGLGQVSFSAQQVERIFSASLGNIAQINDSAREILLEAMPAPKPKSTRVRPALPVMHIVALVVLLAAILVFWQMGDSNKHGDDGHAVVLDGAAKPATSASAAKPATSPFAQVAQVNQQGALQDTGTPAAATAAPEQDGVPVNKQPAQAAQPETAAKTESAPVSVPANEAQSGVVTSAAPEAQVQVGPQSESASEPVVPAVSPKPAPKSAPPVTASSRPAPKPEPKPVAGDPRIAWLKSLPPDHYMLQMMGAEEKATVDRFLAQYPSLQKVVFYRTLRKSKHWYIVVQGNYPSYDAAKAGISKLPASLRREKPWVRKVSAIQQELSK